MENREELLNKLKEINSIYLESEEVLKEIENVEVEDNYERKLEMPKEPRKLEEQEEPTIFYLTKEEQIKSAKYFIKLPIAFLIATFVQVGIYFIAKGGISGKGDDADKIQTSFTNFTFAMIFIFLGVVLVFLALNVLKYFKAIKKYENERKVAVDAYRLKKAEYDKYLERKEQYNKELEEYENKVQECEDEENSIQEKLDKEKESIQEKIRNEKYNPIIEKLKETNNGLLNEGFNLKDLSRVISIIESGRADNIKEALHVLDEIKYRESQQEFERYKLQKEEEARLRQEEEEQERYEEEMWEADRRRQEDLRREAQQRNEDLAREEKRLREERSRNHRDAVSQCSNCRNIHHCRNYGKFANCPNYRPR